RPSLVYLGAVGLLTLLLLAAGERHAAWGGAGVWQQLLVLLVLLVLFIPAVSIAVGLVNLVLGYVLKPRPLPKLDLSEGLPADYRTVVAVPAMLGGAEAVDALLRQLERHYLGNRDDELLFALLTDYADADSADVGTDEAQLSRALAGIRELNRRYGGDGLAPFYLFHRRRLWNEHEGVWMGWERKRGKLVEFNRLLRGATDTSYACQEGDLSRLGAVQFVLTLDADTLLPPGTARRMVGTLAHPLNRAEFDAAGRVVAGYSLLQPRTDVLPESANTTEYSRLFVGENGLDLYTLAVSDVYQDLFGAGIYVGKGMYRVDDFARALKGRVPENSVLSHDLLEGIYAGVGLVTDVVLYEDYPPTYLAQVLRMQRWVRGDWQLLPWLLGGLAGASTSKDGSFGRVGGLGPRGAWQVADNLRRSLLMPSMVLMLALGWTVLPGSPLVWTLMALGTLLVPLFGESVGAVIGALTSSDRSAAGWRQLLPWQQLGDATRRFVITVAFLPFEALVVLRAVVTTLYRLFVSRRRLLQWRTAAQGAVAASHLGLAATALQMGAALALAVGVLLLVVLVQSTALWVAVPVILLWLLAPFIAHEISLSFEEVSEELADEELRRLHRLARRTWLYFEQFVGPDDNWLPPDNVQVGANPVTAHRTSPTNIGLMLLSTMSAHDLGYLGLVDLSLRLKQTVEVLGRLERYRGHLLNWYDTRTLQPLAPRYVSSVDSGNLVGSLIALKEGCFELLESNPAPQRRWGGLVDTVDVLLETVDGPLGANGALPTHLRAIRAELQDGADRPEAWPALFARLEGEGMAELRRLLAEAIEAGSLGPAEGQAARAWAERVSYNVRVTQREFDHLLPWHAAFAALGAWSDRLPGDAKATLTELRALFATAPSLRALAERCEAGVTLLDRFGREAQGAGGAPAAMEAAGAPAAMKVAGDPAAADATAWAQDFGKRLASAAAAARGLVDSFEGVAAAAATEVEGTDFTFLYDEQRELLRIGYNVDAEHLDDNYYDLLASESRLGSLVAIAKGDLPVRHWLHLGRPLTTLGGRATLLSWSGTMFEYLMPPLLTRRYGGTLLEQSCEAAINAQIAYAARLGVPWGMSESGYGRVDGAGTFQYRAFGVPDLALDRGQQDDLIVAPYASVLAVGYRGRAVLTNLQR
ncbi:MAG: glucoamylase family protein, partial [Trueperaceae bacterium]